jgi:iron complex transport system substrate-binding protein
VFVSNPRSLAGIEKSIRQLGQLTGRTESANILADSLHAQSNRVKTIAKQAIRHKVLFLVSLQPLIAVGGDTFLNELIESAGGVNLGIQGASTYPALSREFVLSANPEVILIMSDVASNIGVLTKMYPDFKRVTAVQTHLVFLTNADVLSRPGPRAIDGLQTLFNLIHKGNP